MPSSFIVKAIGKVYLVCPIEKALDIQLNIIDERLIEITNAALNPPRVPTPEPEPEPEHKHESESEPEPEPSTKPEEQTSSTAEQLPTAVSAAAPSESDALAPVSTTSGVIAASNSFRFMQDSELEGPFDEAPANVLVAAVNGHTEQGVAPAPEVRCFHAHPIFLNSCSCTGN